MRSFQANAGLGLLLAVTLLGGPVVAGAQRLGGVPEERVPGSPSHEPRTFGPTASVSHTMQAWALTGFTAADYTAFSYNGISRFCSGVGSYCRRLRFRGASLPPGGSLGDEYPARSV